MTMLTEQEKNSIIMIAVEFYSLNLIPKESTNFPDSVPIAESDLPLLTKAGIIEGNRFHWTRFVPYLCEFLLNDLDPKLDTIN